MSAIANNGTMKMVVYLFEILILFPLYVYPEEIASGMRLLDHMVVPFLNF